MYHASLFRIQEKLFGSEILMAVSQMQIYPICSDYRVAEGASGRCVIGVLIVFNARRDREVMHKHIEKEW